MNNGKLRSFGSLHPLVLLVYFVGTIGISMFSMNPVILGIALLGGLLFYATMCTGRELLSELLFLVPMIILITIINPVFSHQGTTPLFFMNGNPVTMEAILYGADIAILIVSVICWCKCYSMIMTTDKFLFLFGKALPKLSLVMSMAIRFIPVLKNKLREKRNVQKSIGLYNKKGMVNKISAELKVFSSLVDWSLENSADTALSMKARGYGLKGRGHFSIFKFRKRDGIFLALITALLAVSLVGISLGATDFSFYPQITKLNLSIERVIVYLSFGVISFIPFITEITEVILWKYSVWKI